MYEFACICSFDRQSIPADNPKRYIKRRFPLPNTAIPFLRSNKHLFRKMIRYLITTMPAMTAAEYVFTGYNLMYDVLPRVRAPVQMDCCYMARQPHHYPGKHIKSPSSN